MKVLVQVPLSPYTGYGNDGIGIARALIRWGADVYLQPTTVQAPIPPDVAYLLTKKLEAPFDLTIAHVNPGQLEANQVMTSNSKMVIGWTMWESTNFATEPNSVKFREAWKNFDAMVAYDDVSRAALADHYDGPILVQQGGYWPEQWPEIERDWDEQNFYYCMVGMLTERKDPFKAIQAFAELKDEYPDEFEPARLSLKTMAPGLHSALQNLHPWLRIYYEVWDDKTLMAFYASQHVLLAPSRGEGKNMPALEFQSTGGAVIATDWGGHKQWLNPMYNYPLNYELKPVDVEHPETFNARADVEHLKALILQTFRNRNEAREKGHIASQVIPAMSSWDSVFRRLFDALAEVGEKGQVVQMKAEMCHQEVERANR
jgi:glycosyltransferase involved in cell wall biosynthesis